MRAEVCKEAWVQPNKKKVFGQTLRNRPAYRYISEHKLLILTKENEASLASIVAPQPGCVLSTFLVQTVKIITRFAPLQTASAIALIN
jgi:hypothetical protein